MPLSGQTSEKMITCRLEGAYFYFIRKLRFYKTKSRILELPDI